MPKEIGFQLTSFGSCGVLRVIGNSFVMKSLGKKEEEEEEEKMESGVRRRRRRRFRASLVLMCCVATVL